VQEGMCFGCWAEEPKKGTNHCYEKKIEKRHCVSMAKKINPMVKQAVNDLGAHQITR
jgi:hypothetical protein